jgi:hypothetical protein
VVEADVSSDTQEMLWGAELAKKEMKKLTNNCFVFWPLQKTSIFVFVLWRRRFVPSCHMLMAKTFFPPFLCTAKTFFWKKENGT